MVLNKSYVIEVKPKKQVTGPKKQKEKDKKIFGRGHGICKEQVPKWKAAEEFCADRLWEFKIVTEDELWHLKLCFLRCMKN